MSLGPFELPSLHNSHLVPTVAPGTAWPGTLVFLPAWFNHTLACPRTPQSLPELAAR